MKTKLMELGKFNFYEIERNADGVYVCDALAGSLIPHAIEELAEFAQEHGKAEATFNGITLQADMNSTAAGLKRQWEDESERRHQAYLNSPGYAESQKKESAELAGMQALTDELMSGLPRINCDDLAQVINWLGSYQQATDHTGVKADHKRVARFFMARGFVPNANCEDDFREDDRENFARWLIGQALDGLERGMGIHPVYQKFAAQWRDKFEEQHETD